MMKENIVELTIHRETEEMDQPMMGTANDELCVAIQHLIHRLKELGPLQS